MPTVTFELTSATSEAASSGNQAWTNPDRALDDDSLRAEFLPSLIAGGGNSQWLQLVNPTGGSIPSGATINGIKVTVKRRAYDTYGAGNPARYCRDLNVVLVKGGTRQTAHDKGLTALDWPTVEGSQDYGGAADLWGNTWADTDFGATFGVAIRATSNTDGTEDELAGQVNYVTVEVTYTGGSTVHEGQCEATVSVSASSGSQSNLLGEGAATMALTGLMTPVRTLYADASIAVTVITLCVVPLFGAGTSEIVFTGAAEGTKIWSGSAPDFCILFGAHANGQVNLSPVEVTAESEIDGVLIAVTASGDAVRTAYDSGQGTVVLAAESGSAVTWLAPLSEGFVDVFGDAGATLTLNPSATAGVTVTATAEGCQYDDSGATASIVVAGSADGLRTAFGAAEPLIDIAQTSAGYRTVTARTSYSDPTQVIVTALGAGRIEHRGAGSITVVLTASAVGSAPHNVAASAGVALTGAANGHTWILGAGAAGVALTGTATPVVNSGPRAPATVSLGAVADGSRAVKGTASGSVAITGSAIPHWTPAGTASWSIAFTASASGRLEPGVSASGGASVTALAAGRLSARVGGTASIVSTASAGDGLIYGAYGATAALSVSLEAPEGVVSAGVGGSAGVSVGVVAEGRRTRLTGGAVAVAVDTDGDGFVVVQGAGAGAIAFTGALDSRPPVTEEAVGADARGEIILWA